MGPRKGHPAAPTDRGRSNTDTQNAGATPGGTRASAADKDEGHSKAGEASRTAGTGSQNRGDGRACACEAAATKGMAWPASPVATGCQDNPCSTGIRWGGLPQPRWAVCTTGAGAHQGQTSREGEKGIWWTAGTTRGGTGHLGLTHTEPQRGRLWTACGQRRMDSKNSQTTPATTSTSSIRQLLGAADAQTAHHATFSTAPTHQLLGSANGNGTNKSTGRSGRQNAATRRNMRREERVIVQGPVKEQQPDGMSHRGGSPGAAGEGGGGCIRRAGTSEEAPGVIRQAVGEGCESGSGRLLSVANAVEVGTWRRRNSGWALAGRPGGGGWGVPPTPPSNASLGAGGGATPRVLGRRPPPPPQGAAGSGLWSPWAPEAPTLLPPTRGTGGHWCLWSFAHCRVGRGLAVSDGLAVCEPPIAVG